MTQNIKRESLTCLSRQLLLSREQARMPVYFLLDVPNLQLFQVELHFFAVLCG